LQYKDKESWYDEAYAYEDEQGQVVLRYNLTWERTGAHFNDKFREQQTPLEEVETVILPSEALRWLPIETIPAEEIDTFLAHLNETCAIPQPGSVKQRQVA
jgi:hypothetical protein